MVSELMERPHMAGVSLLLTAWFVVLECSSALVVQLNLNQAYTARFGDKEPYQKLKKFFSFFCRMLTCLKTY